MGKKTKGVGGASVCKYLLRGLTKFWFPRCHSPLVSWCHSRDWPPPWLWRGQLGERRHDFNPPSFHKPSGAFTVRKCSKITLSVLVIVWIFRQVSQVIWNTGPNTEGSTIAGKHAKELLCSRFKEFDLKPKSWMKASAGAYISKLHKSDVRDILHISVSSNLLDPCHKLTRDTGPVMSANLTWASLQKSYEGRWKFQRAVFPEQQGAARGLSWSAVELN